jgi:hypothetical protein
MRNTEKFLFLFYCHHNLSISLHLKFLKRVIVSSRMLSWMQAVPQLPPTSSLSWEVFPPGTHPTHFLLDPSPASAESARKSIFGAG